MFLEHIAFPLGVPPLQVPLAGLHYNRWCFPLSSGSFALQVLLLMQVPPASEDDRLAKAALFTKFTGVAAVGDTYLSVDLPCGHVAAHVAAMSGFQFHCGMPVCQVAGIFTQCQRVPPHLLQRHCLPRCGAGASWACLCFLSCWLECGLQLRVLQAPVAQQLAAAGAAACWRSSCLRRLRHSCRWPTS